MTPSEIAETLINGNITDARNAICPGRNGRAAAVLALDVLDEMVMGASDGNDIAVMMHRLRRCLTGGT